MTHSNTDALGIDIGGVIIARIDATSDTSFARDDFLKTPAVDHAIEAIGDLRRNRFGAEVHLVSKCGPKVQEMTCRWLQAHDFFERTRTSSAHLHFCLERWQKDGICKSLGITHFIDDRLEVLSSLSSVPNLYLFQPQEAEVAKYASHLSRVNRVESWQDVVSLLMPGV